MGGQKGFVKIWENSHIIKVMGSAGGGIVRRVIRAVKFTTGLS
jgi:hypothetical protein